MEAEMLARGSEMVSELSLDLFWLTNGVIWTQTYLGFDWFGAIVGAFLTTEFVRPRFTFQSKCVCFAFRALLHCQGGLFSLEQVRGCIGRSPNPIG